MRKNRILSAIFLIMLSTILFISLCSAIGCKLHKNDNDLNETISGILDESDGNGGDETSEGKMYAITNSWYKYKTVNKLVTEVYEKDQLLVKNEYDSDGYRIKKTAGDTVTTFKYDKEYQLIKEVCISNKTGTHTLNYTYELQYSDVKGPEYKLTGFTYNGHNYTFKMGTYSDEIVSIYEGEKCVVAYSEENHKRIVYEVKNGEKIKNENQDFIGNLNGVIFEHQYYYDDETGMSLNKDLRWYSSYGTMSYYDREYDKPVRTNVIWTPSNGDKYAYNDKNLIEKIVNGNKVIADYKYSSIDDYGYNLIEKVSDSNVIKYEYFTVNEDIVKGKYFMSDIFIENSEYARNETENFYKTIQPEFENKLKSVNIIIDDKEHKITYKYGYENGADMIGPYWMMGLSVSGFSYNGRTYKFEFANYDSELITGIIDDKGDKIVSYKIENEGSVYYNRKTYEIKDGVEIENNSPEFIGNLNLIVCDDVLYDIDCKVNFNAIKYKR